MEQPGYEQPGNYRQEGYSNHSIQPPPRQAVQGSKQYGGEYGYNNYVPEQGSHMQQGMQQGMPQGMPQQGKSQHYSNGQDALDLKMQ